MKHEGAARIHAAAEHTRAGHAQLWWLAYASGIVGAPEYVHGMGWLRRKRKLLEKQKEGKARMRRVGQVGLPQDVFHSLMRT